MSAQGAKYGRFPETPVRPFIADTDKEIFDRSLIG
jgi:hypothetical protein